LIGAPRRVSHRYSGGVLAGRVLAEDAGNAFNRSLKMVVGLRRGEFNIFDHSGAIGVDPGSAMNHQIELDGASRSARSSAGKNGNINSKLILTPLSPCLPPQW
jgi:hypothetical protein